MNWPVAKMADAQVILVADIDRGGVFAQVIGTLDLLSADERRSVIGVIINKFRGDLSLFDDGVKYLEERTRLPVLGVIPFQRKLELDQEDSVEIERNQNTFFTRDKVNVAVTLLPHMSNFTDFNSLAGEPDVVLRYVKSPQELAGADVVILPGSKSTMADLDYLHEAGFAIRSSKACKRAGRTCGHLRRLPDAWAGNFGSARSREAAERRDGLGFLDVVTELTSEKRTVQVEARPLLPGTPVDCAVQGYEIHMGQTTRGKAAPCFRILSHEREKAEPMDDGAISDDYRTWGTYIHGVFDNSRFRRHWLNQIRQRKGLAALPMAVSENVNQRLAFAMDKWADHLERHLNLATIFDGFDRGNSFVGVGFRAYPVLPISRNEAESKL